MVTHQRRAPGPCCSTVPAAQGDEAELFRRHQRRLVRSVQSAVGVRRDLAEDGCAFAWAQLLAYQPERSERLFGWLRKVALRTLAALRPRECRYLALLIGGHSYREIQEICGGRSSTNVNKHLVRARAR